MNKFDVAMMTTAFVWSRLSHGKKKKVGAIIAQDNRIVSVGYNGLISGLSNTLEVDGKTDPAVIHAEENALLFCAKKGIPTERGYMYVTCLPCSRCATRICQAGIKKVFFSEMYIGSNGDGRTVFTQANVEIEQIKLEVEISLNE
ncbi:MAG: deaminase [Gammaproteobacteria bacterium]|nr:deaminase [Gammaproteobacteria bacterium]